MEHKDTAGALEWFLCGEYMLLHCLMNLASIQVLWTAWV